MFSSTIIFTENKFFGLNFFFSRLANPTLQAYSVVNPIGTISQVQTAKEFIDENSPYQVATYTRPDIVFNSGKGSHLFDSEGNQYLDFTAGIAVTGLGHSHGGIAKVIAEQASTLIHASNLYYNQYTPQLSKALVEVTKKAGGFPSAHSSFIANSGTEANEAALKFARKWGKVQGGSNESSKVELVSFTGSFHGRSFGALSVTPNPKYQAPFGPMVPGVKTGKFNQVEGLKELITENTAGVIVEPIQGEGGVNVATPEFLKAVRERCTEVGAALIFDEIQCGLGRTGSLWAHQNFPGIQPDILTVAKALGNGFPIAAVVVNEQVSSAIKVGDHGTTYGGNPLGSRIALEVLKRISSPKLLEGVKIRGEIVSAKFTEFQKKYPKLVKEYRGKGLIQGLELTVPASEVTSIALNKKLLIINAGEKVVRFIPALNIPISDLKKGLDILDTALETVNSKL